MAIAHLPYVAIAHLRYGFLPTRRLFSLPMFFLREVTRRFLALSLPLSQSRILVTVYLFQAKQRAKLSKLSP
jgi:hypothetical protein